MKCACTIPILFVVVSLSATAAPSLVTDMDELDNLGMELEVGEKRKAEIEARKAVPPKVVGRWNFDDMVPGKAGHPRGWWSGIWGDRKVNYGSDVGADGTGRSFLVDVRSIVGGELKSYTAMMEKARTMATNRMIDEAVKLGADAIIGVRYTTSAIMAQAAEVLVYGTAIRYKG